MELPANKMRLGVPYVVGNNIYTLVDADVARNIFHVLYQRENSPDSITGVSGQWLYWFDDWFDDTQTQVISRCTCATHLLLQSGCTCGHITRYRD